MAPFGIDLQSYIYFGPIRQGNKETLNVTI